MAAVSKRFVKNCTGDKCDKKQKESSKIVSRLVFYFLLFLFFAVFVYVIVFSPYLEITKVQISGTQELNQQDVENSVSQMMNGKFLNIFPKDNFLLISDSGIQNSLTDQYKKIRSVQIKKEFPNKLNIAIDERRALLVWCSTEEKCYLVDENGVAYNEADFSSPELSQNHLLKVNDKSQSELKLGDKIMNDNFENYLTTLSDAMQKLGIVIGGQFFTPSSVSQEITAQTENGALLYFSTQYPLEEATKTLGIILKKEISKENLNNIEYIDLRTENKVFYKLKGQQQENPQQQDNTALPQENTDKKQKEKK